MNNVIQVDRFVDPIYPDWVTKVLRPELARFGPPMYDLASIKLWFHDAQKRGALVTGHDVYRLLKEVDLLRHCLDLRDGIEIVRREERAAVFKSLFGGNSLFLWKSVVRFGEDMRVPAVPYGGEGNVWWVNLDFFWRSADAAACFKT